LLAAANEDLQHALELETQLKAEAERALRDEVSSMKKEVHRMSLKHGAVKPMNWDNREISVMSEDADTGFPCSWTFAEGSAAAEPNTLVKDCWGGVAMARDMGWINHHSLKDDLCVSLACSQYIRMVHEYDATWFEPGRMVVSADPMSTVNDPNPETCDQLLPGSQVVGKDQTRGNHIWTASANASSDDSSENGLTTTGLTPNNSHMSLCTIEDDGMMLVDTKSDTSKATADWPLEIPRGCDDDKSTGSRSTHRAVAVAIPQAGMRPNGSSNHTSEQPSSCHTVCKSYRPAKDQANADGRPPNGLTGNRKKPQDFVTWLQSQHVGVIIRANRSDERGLVEHGGSYDPQVMEKCGIQHVDLPVLDKHGGIPDAHVIQSAIEEASNVGSEGSEGHKAMLVHCKGGFGRSVVLACCILIHWHDMPGRSLLGWARIVRPGSITTIEQERFLCRLRGREDLKKCLCRGPKSCCGIM